MDESLEWPKYLSLRIPLQRGKRGFYKIYPRSLGKAQPEARYDRLARVKRRQTLFFPQIFLRHVAAIPGCRSVTSRCLQMRIRQVNRGLISAYPNFQTVLPRAVTIALLSLFSCVVLEVLYFRRSLAPKQNAAVPAKANIMNSRNSIRRQCHSVANICAVD